MTEFKKRAHEILEVAPKGDWVSRAFDFFIIILVLLNATALILDTVPTIHAAASEFFFLFEAVSVTIFLVEYLLRVWACTAEPKYSHPVYGRIRFALSPLLLIDLLAIVPFFLPFLGYDLRFLRTVRLLARAARLGRYFSGIRTLGLVVRNRSIELLTVVMVLAVMLVLASSLIYFAEHQAQPEEFGSIPVAMWWSIITLTTVGYGDVSPITALGKLMAGAIAVMGIGLFALPAGILGSGFLEEIQRRRGQTDLVTVCPHCGEEIGN